MRTGEGVVSTALVEQSWDRIETWLARHAPETFATLRPGASTEAVLAAQRETGLVFPDDLVASLRRHDGVEQRPGGFRLPGGHTLLSAAAIPAQTRTMADAIAQVDTGGSLLGTYWHPQWILIAPDGSGGALALDARPGATLGAVGQLEHGEGTRFGRWGTIGDLLAAVADALERGAALDRRLPLAFGGRLAWEFVEEVHPSPRSLLELAESAREPAVPARRRAVLEPVPEAGWVGEFTGFCLSFVHGVGEAELLRRFGAQPRTAVPRTRQEALDVQDMWTEGFLPVVRVGRAGDWAFAVEEGHWEATRPEVLRRLSTGTHAVVLHHSGFTSFALATDGRTVTTYDTRHPDERAGSEPDLLLAELRAARLVPLDHQRYPDEDVYALLDVLRTRLGIAFDGTALSGPLPGAQFLPALAGPPAGQVMSVHAEPVIATLVAHAPEDRLRAALVTQARRLAAETGLGGYPEVVDALDRAATGRSWTVDDDSALGIRLRTVAAEAHAALESRRDERARDLMTEPERRAWQRRATAAQAIVGVLGRPPREAAPFLLRSRVDPRWREELAVDLGDVVVPEGAAEALAAAEATRAAAPRRAAPLVMRPQRRSPTAPRRVGVVAPMTGGTGTGARVSAVRAARATSTGVPMRRAVPARPGTPATPAIPAQVTPPPTAAPPVPVMPAPGVVSTPPPVPAPPVPVMPAPGGVSTPPPVPGPVVPVPPAPGGAATPPPVPAPLSPAPAAPGDPVASTPPRPRTPPEAPAPGGGALPRRAPGKAAGLPPAPPWHATTDRPGQPHPTPGDNE